MKTNSLKPSNGLNFSGISGVFLSVFAGLMTTTAHGQTLWTGDADSDWNNSANWSGGVPGTGSNAIVKSETGDNQPILEAPSELFNSLFIGSVDGSQLTLQNGGQLATGSAIFGNSSVNDIPSNQLSSEMATVTVNGPTSSFSSDFLSLGIYGSGKLSLSNGATLTTTNSIQMGTVADSQGELTLSGEGTTASIGGGVVIGQDGTGVLNVLEGADVSSGAATIGNEANSISSANVFGLGSTWGIESGNLVIGGMGEGTLSISDEGRVDASGRVFVGNSAGSIGHLDIAGVGSVLESSGYVAIGNQGDGHGSVTDGGVLQGSEVLVSWYEDSESDLLITGAGSEVNVGNYLMVGFNGDANTTIADGASINALSTGTSASVRLAYGDTSTATLNIGAVRGSGPVAAGYVNVGLLAFGEGEGELVFNHSNTDYEFTAEIQNSGTISHLAGDTYLTANSGDFTGTTNIEGGTLHIGEALGGVVNVQNGGTLGGAGDLSSLIVASGGGVAPNGNLHVQGNASFDAGSFYMVDADPNSVDQLSASGIITLNGGTVLHQESAATFQPFSRYVIVSADGGVSGEFDTVQSELAFMNPELDYTTNEVWLELLRNDVDLTDIALTVNQRNVGTALSGLTEDDLLVRTILMMSEGNARLSYDQLSGAIHGSSAAMLIQDTEILHDLMNQRSRPTGVSAGEETVNRLSFASDSEAASNGLWIQTVGARSHFDGDGNANATQRNLGGLVFGYDEQIGNNMTAGLMAGMLNASLSNADGAEADADSVSVGGYLATNGSGLQFSGGALVSWHEVDTVRSLVALGQGPAVSEYDARTYSLHAGAHYETELLGHSVEPFVTLATVGYESDSFTETGGLGSLSIDGMSTQTTFSTIGIRGEADLSNANFAGKSIVATGLIGWSHAFGDVAPGISAELQGNALTTYGMPISRNELKIEAGVDMQLSDSSKFRVSYFGSLAENYNDHGLEAALKVAF